MAAVDQRFEMRAPGVGDLGWVVARHGVVYHESYGWDASFEALVAGVVGRFAEEHVEPWARGLGIGGALVEACVGFAREAGYRRMILWTDDFLVGARHLYAAAGFRLVNSRTEVAFGAKSVAEDWELVF